MTVRAVTVGMRTAVMALAFGIGLMTSGLAYGFDLGSGSGEIDLKADNGIEWRSENKVIIASGHAQASRNGVTVKADQLIAHYRETDAGTDIWQLEAKGNVVISTDKETATGKEAVYDVDKRVFILYGDPVRLTSAEQTITATDSIEYWEDKNMAVARGDATVVKGDRTIRADVLVAHFARNRSGAMELASAEAFDNVVLTTAKDKIYGEKGDYDVRKEIATLSGSVRIERDGNTLNGGYAWVDTKSGISKLFGKAPSGLGGDGRVHGTFTPQKTMHNPLKPVGTPTENSTTGEAATEGNTP